MVRRHVRNIEAEMVDAEGSGHRREDLVMAARRIHSSQLTQDITGGETEM